MLVSEANAQWLETAQLVISLTSLFMHSDGGMSAMLSNIRELQLETIKLLQDVILQLGKIQAALAKMPEVIRRELNFHSEYNVQADMTEIANDLQFYEAQARRGFIHKDRLLAIVANSEKLSRMRSVPYGIGGTGAVCAPLVAAMDGRARQLLGRRKEMSDACHQYFLPAMAESHTVGARWLIVQGI